MCGIAGFTGAQPEGTLRKMLQRLHHRGPDDIGQLETPKIALGMTRLAIVDVDSGQQPVANEDNSVVCLMNGEIFNHRQIRARLESQGHRFRSDHSDTEVLPHLYEEKGQDFLLELNGMFAIALWNSRKMELLLARDQCGIKPLFYALTSTGDIVFGSEIKALLAHPSILPQPDYESLFHYLTFKNVPSPATAYSNIKQLRPGQRLYWRRGYPLRIEQWWKIPASDSVEYTEQDAKTEVRRLLEESVKLQMDCDVPFGAYLSGGVDSSAVVALMAQYSTKPIRTFTLAYEDKFAGKSSDEKFAREVAKRYGCDHYVHTLSGQEVCNSIEKVLDSFDEPFSGTISTFYLTQLISRHVKVALSGDGADELFGSYLPHRLAQPLSVLSEAGGAIEQLRTREKGLTSIAPFEGQVDFLLQTYRRGNEAERRMGQYVFDDQAKLKVLSPEFRSKVAGISSLRLVQKAYNKLNITDPLNRALLLDFETLLPDQVLAFVDRLSMAHSVEVRPPFLDVRLIEFVARLPGTYKIKHGRVKSLLKDAVSDLLPADLIDRPKEGFVLPINEWILTGLKPFVMDLLSPSSVSAAGLLDPDGVATLLNLHYSGQRKQPTQIWNLVNLQLWWRKHFV